MKKLFVRKKQTLKEFLAENLKVSKNRAKEIIDSKVVFVNNRRVWIATHNLKEGDIVEVVQVEEKKEFNPQIVYEDEYIIAVNKPPSVLSDKSPDSLESLLRKYRKDDNIKAIHRLDKETSGLILYAKNFEIYETFVKLWENRQIKKVYLAISHNEAEFKHRLVDLPLDGKEAVSRIKLLKKGNGLSYFEVEIQTGRKHQIRRHLAAIRHPVVGDKVYGLKKLEFNLLKSVKRHMLHAYLLEFIHPYTGKKVAIKASPPADFMNVLHYIKQV